MTSMLKRFVSNYGMLFALILLCVYYSYATMQVQQPEGAAAAEQVTHILQQQAAARQTAAPMHILIVAQGDPREQAYVDALRARLQQEGLIVAAAVAGEPRDARKAMEELQRAGQSIHFVAATAQSAQWSILRDAPTRFPVLRGAEIITPRSYKWPNFLKHSNLMAIADRIVVIAIIAIGMTMVIITGGIDLSVGSLIALAAVSATMLIQGYAGAEQATPMGMALCCLAAIALCGLIGAITGSLITVFSVAPFIVTLAMMLIASGLAYILSQGQSIYQVPEGLTWLGRGADLFGIPNTVVLMVGLYLLAYVLMSRTILGRHIYAVGGNVEAARLSGVPVKRVLLFVYVLCGALAGLGGIIQASQLKSGAPTYGQMYELYVIAAVAVGGTSLSGGEGRVLGTLIGAFIIAVIQNGMNLTGIESYTQKVVFGLVILIAVMLDMLKSRGWRGLRLWSSARHDDAATPAEVRRDA